MLLVLQTEEENDAFVAAIGAIMDKGEAENTPAELNFLTIVAPIVEAYEQQLYGYCKICKCAQRNIKENNRSVEAKR